MAGRISACLRSHIVVHAVLWTSLVISLAWLQKQVTMQKLAGLVCCAVLCPDVLCPFKEVPRSKIWDRYQANKGEHLESRTRQDL